MTRFVLLGARKPFLPNWAVATSLAGLVTFTYFYSIRAVSNDDLDKEISKQLQQQTKYCLHPFLPTSFTSLSGNNPPFKTSFRERVFAKCKEIPIGKVTTYGQIAKSLGTSPRAVGQALRCNNRKDVPCHRVIRSDRSIGGFHGNFGMHSTFVKLKISKLRKEGVRFESDGVVCSTGLFLDL